MRVGVTSEKTPCTRQSVGTGDTASTAAPSRDDPRVHSCLLRALACGLVLLQTLWAVIIPIKNVVVMPYPKINEDRVTVEEHPYDRDSDQIATRRIPGKEAFRIVKEVVELSLTNSVLRSYFETKNDFVIDDISHLLTPEQHQLFGQYYSMVFQASEMQAGGVIPREQKVIVVLEDTKEEFLVTIMCSREQVFSGMRCLNQRGVMCDNVDWQNVDDLTFIPVDLATLTNGTGWHNKISLLGFITHTHNSMRTLFEKKDWTKAFHEIPYKWRTEPTSDPTILKGVAADLGGSSPWNPRMLKDYLQAGIRKYESCFNTEFLLGYHFAGFYAAGIIQKPLLDLKLYGATDLINNTESYDTIFEEMFGNDILITTGAGHNGFVDDKKTFVGTPMTEVLTSTVNWKKDRPMTGPVAMGSGPRNLEYWMYYPDIFYSYHNDSLEGDTVVVDYRELGGYHSGFYGFKFDLVHNTMGAIRLSERRWSRGTGYPTDWFDEEKQIAQWYRKHELNDSNSLISMSKNVWGQDIGIVSGQPFCMEGIYRRIAQTVWIMALQKQPVMNHLVYQSMVDADTPAAWWFKQLSVNQIVGEQITGFRVPYPYFRDTYWVVDGESWVLIPLLNTFRKEIGEEQLLEDVMAAMNTTFYTLLEVRSGVFMQFCRLGFATLGVTVDDSKEVAYNKLYGKFYEMIKKTISMVDSIHEQMISAGFHVVIPHEYVVYNRTNSVFHNEGPPVYWTHQPLSIGLIKLSTFVSPDDSQMRIFRDSLVCYDTLETRFLNLSTRCWSEPRSIKETFEKATSDRLRMLKFSMWSLGVVLNINGAVVALRFAWRIWILWQNYRFSDLTLALAMNLNFQGIGTISFDGVVIMAFSCVPLILSYHLPADPKFMPNENEKPNPVFAECMVLLGLTWFIRLGIEFGIKLISLKYYNWWFKRLSTWIRVFTLLAILLMRQAFTSETIDYNYGLTKLIVSCVVSMALGFISVMVSVRFDQENPHSKDILSRMMTEHRLARNVHGVVGQLQCGWSHAGLIVEGWQVFKRRGEVSMLVRGDLPWMPVGSFSKDYELVSLTPEILMNLQRENKVAPSDTLLQAARVRVSPHPS